MSIQALEWARRQIVGDALAKSLLRAFADYADEQGHCWPSIGRLASDCEVSEDTIRRKTKFLEDGDYLVRIRAFVDDLGRRNTEGRGRETSSEIRLRMARIAPPEASKVVMDSAADEGEGSHTARVAGCEGSRLRGSPVQTHGSDTAPPGVAVERPPNELPLKKEEDSPHSPPSGGVTSDDVSGSEAGESWPHLESWKRFEAAWHEPILRQRLCRQLWSAFTDVEREQAILVAQGYVIWRTGQRKPPNCVNAERMLRERDAWPGYIARAPKPKVIEAPPPRTRIAADSAEYLALQVACMIAGIEPPRPLGEPPGTVAFIGEVPHGAHAMAMLADEATWVIREKNTPEFKAWCGRVKEWTGRWPDAKRFWLDQQGNVVASAAEAYRPPGALVPRAIDGLRVPMTATGFPPPKGGDPPKEQRGHDAA